MRVGNYSLLVPEGSEKDSGHIAMPHGRQYSMRLSNHDHRKCDAEVIVDGKTLGVFRLHGYGSAVLERSPDDHGRFAFYADGTADAQAAGIETVATPDRGLIQVKFTPEKPRPPMVTRSAGGLQSMKSMSRGPGGQHQNSSRSLDFDPSESGPHSFGAAEKTSGGITGLSGHSNQAFTTVGPIDRDEAATVTISVRLVAANDGPRPLKAAVERANPVPAPVS